MKGFKMTVTFSGMIFALVGFAILITPYIVAHYRKGNQ